MMSTQSNMLDYVTDRSSSVDANKKRSHEKLIYVSKTKLGRREIIRIQSKTEDEN